MDTLKISGLKRNPDIIKDCFKIVKDTTITTKDIKVIFPSRYVNKELAIIGSTIRVVSYYAIIDEDDNYAVVSAPIYVELSPYNIKDVIVEGSEYKLLEFNKGDIFIGNNTLVKSDNFMYELFEEFFIKGNIPWFLSYEDVSNLLLETNKYAGSNIGKNPLIMEILTSVIARNKSDKRINYRYDINNGSKSKPSYIGLNNIYYSFDNTGAKLIGGYFGQGVTNALVDPETKTSKVSEILRS